MAMSRSFGAQIVDDAPVDQDVAGADRLEPGDHVEKRRLAAAGRAEQDEKLAVVGRQADVGERRVDAELLRDVPDFERRHRAISP